MTNEEAKEWIEVCVQNYICDGDINSEEILEARDMVIEALESQQNKCDSCQYLDEQNGEHCYECIKGMNNNFKPCEDAISREDAIREIQDKYGDNAVGIDIVDIVAHLPSVRPCREIVEDKRACEKCIHYVTRDSRGVVLCGCDSWECDFEEVKT